MDPLPLPPIQDVARIVRDSEPEIVERLIDYYSRAGFFNYGTAYRLAPHILSHKIPLAAGLQECETDWSVAGRTQNAEVLRHVWHQGEGRKIVCYPLSSREFPIRSDLSIRVNPVCFFVEDKQAKIYCLQPRRGFSLNTQQLALYVSIVKMRFLVDDFERAGIELLDLSVPAGSKDRAPRILHLSDLPILSDSAVEAALQRFASAYDRVRELGIKKATRPSKPKDAPESGLFDDPKS